MLEKQAATLLGDWKNAKPFTRVPNEFFDIPAKEVVIETPDKAQAFFVAGIERGDVIHVDALEARGNTVAKPALVHELGIGGGADDEAGRHRESGRCELAEVGALTAGKGDVRMGQLGESADRGGRGGGGSAHGFAR